MSLVQGKKTILDANLGVNLGMQQGSFLVLGEPPASELKTDLPTGKGNVPVVDLVPPPLGVIISLLLLLLLLVGGHVD